MVQERNVITADVQVTPVGLGHPGQLIQILDHRALGIMYDAAIVPKTHSWQFFDRFTIRKGRDLMIEFTPHDKVNRGALECLLRLYRDWRSDKRDLQLR